MHQNNSTGVSGTCVSGTCVSGTGVSGTGVSGTCVSGFSLIELTVVLAILVILISFTLPKQHFLTQALLENEANMLLTTFSFLQKKAVASHEKQELIFLENKNCYSYKLGNRVITHTLAPPLLFGYTPGSKGPPSCPKKLISHAVTFRKKNNLRTALFYPTGKISPGTVYLIDKKQKLRIKSTRVEDSDYCMKALTCPVSQVSFIRIYHHKHKWVL